MSARPLSRDVAHALSRDLALLLAALALGVALVLPPLPLTRTVYDLQVTFDISQSMGVEDVALDGRPASRLVFAKAAAAALLRALPCGSRVGWSAFVERRTMTLTLPLEVCAHYEALRATLDDIDARMRWGEASGIGYGLQQSLRAASEIGHDTAVVMLTDAQEAPPLAPGRSGFPKSDVAGVHGLLAGVGGDVPVPIPKLDAEGRVVGVWRADEVVQPAGAVPGQIGEERSRLDAEHLAALAGLAGIGHARLVRPADLARALEPTRAGQRSRVATDVSPLPAALALLCLCWRFRPAVRVRPTRRREGARPRGPFGRHVTSV